MRKNGAYSFLIKGYGIVTYTRINFLRIFTIIYLS